MRKEAKTLNVKSMIIIAMFAVAFAIFFSNKSSAENNNMSDLQSQLQENQENQSSYQEQASDLQNQKNTLEQMVTDLNTQIEEINQNIDQIQTEIDEKNKEIEDTQTELDAAEKTEQEQYESMKLRIKYMYEAGDDTFIDILISGDSFSSVLDKIEYTEKLTSYDRDMLQKYKDTKQEIEDKKLTLDTEKTELDNLMTEMNTQHQLIEEKISDTQNQIQEYSSQISEAESKAKAYEEEAAKNMSAIEKESQSIEESKLLEQAKKEKASRAAARAAAGIQTGGEGETTYYINNGNTFTDDEVEMLAALIECEAGNQPYYGMLCVGAVVVNRINSTYYPNNLYDVIHQPYQFTPVSVSNRYDIVFARGASDICYQAAREVLVDGHITGDWLYFRVNDGSRQGDVIGDHVFY